MKKHTLAILAATVFTAWGCTTEERLVLREVTTLRLVPDENIAFGEAGGSVEIRVQTNAESWKAEATQEGVRIEPAADSFRIVADANNRVEAMPDAEVTVVAVRGDESDRVRIAVSQEGAEEAELRMEPDVETFRILYTGSTMEFFVASNKTWTVTSDRNWCTATKSDEHTLVLSAPENPSFEPMPPATVTVTAGTAPNAVVKRIAVTQEGRPEIVVTDLSADGTSNCYVVGEAGSYMFNGCVIGNNAATEGITPVTLSPVAARLLWQDYYADGKGVVADVEYENGYVYFATPEPFHPGNALIAVTDASGTILWSWHIWCVSDLQEHRYDSFGTANEAFRVLDRNLGALSCRKGSDLALGLYYQWGRKDPFPAAAGHGDGTGRKDLQLAFCWSAPDDFAQPGYTARIYDAEGQTVNSADRMLFTLETGGKEVADAVRHPMCFYYQISSAQSDWLAVSDDGLWGNPWSNGKKYVFDGNAFAEVSTGTGVKTIYDPCPVGYKVAPGNYWCETGMVLTRSFHSPSMTYDAASFGYVFTTADGYEDWYPLAGRRQYTTNNAGRLYGVSTSGFWWSSSPAADPSGDISDSQRQSAATVSVSKNAWTPVSSIRRSNGMPVRCVRE